MVARQEQAAEVFLHIGWWARHPDADSNFARSIGRLPDIADAELFAALIQKGYDGLLYTNENEIIGHCFFQRHGAELHGFSVWVSEQHRGGNLMTIACFDFMSYASACQGIVEARFGTGHPGDRLLRPLKRCSAGLGGKCAGAAGLISPRTVRSAPALGAVPANNRASNWPRKR